MTLKAKPSAQMTLGARGGPTAVRGMSQLGWAAFPPVPKQLFLLWGLNCLPRMIQSESPLCTWMNIKPDRATECSKRDLCAFPPAAAGSSGDTPRPIATPKFPDADHPLPVPSSHPGCFVPNLPPHGRSGLAALPTRPEILGSCGSSLSFPGGMR